MLTGQTKILQGDECVSKYAESHCASLAVSSTLSCCCWIPIWNRALWSISAYIDIYPLWSVKRPLSSKPSSLPAARELGTWLVAEVTEKNVGNCKQWLKKERKREKRGKVEKVALMLLYPTLVYFWFKLRLLQLGGCRRLEADSINNR